MKKSKENILKQVLSKIEPQREDLSLINQLVNNFKKKLDFEIKKQKLGAEVFEGGSYAKKTLIRKGVYDVDIFIRFPKNLENKDLSKLAKKLLKKLGKSEKFSVVHGSRDYFRIKKSKNFVIEVVPVLKIKTPSQAKNVTDLSYSHVKYVNKKTNKKLLEEIKIAKAFCHANNCYGAESYIQGFSGYALELLICYYGSFLKFIKSISKSKKDKIIIDQEKHYKNKNEVLREINSSKLESPIVLVDPTCKNRNALAALSNETFEEFKKSCKKFLKNPSIEDFEIKKVNINDVKSNAKKKGYDFILIEASTNKQSGDIAGTKLKKFYKHLEKEASNFFEIKNKGFKYSGKKSGRFFFVLKPKKEIIFKGPFEDDEKNLSRFKKAHKNLFKKGKRFYSKEKINFKADEFIINWKKANNKKIKQMSIKKLKII